jgi:dolichol kinase
VQVLYQSLLAVAVLLYFLCVVPLIANVLARWTSLPPEVRRKSTHISMAIGSIFVFKLFQSWYIAILPFVLMAIIANLLWALLGRWFTKSFDQSTYSGFQRQAIFLPFSFITLIGICWGLGGYHSRQHAIVGILCMLIGDSAAAIVGTRWGKTHYTSKYFDPAKTVEGSAAMVVGAWLGIQAAHLSLGTWSLDAMLTGFGLAVLAAFIEAISRWGTDAVTVSVPTGVLSLLMSL